jgi:hypothetical protein
VVEYLPASPHLDVSAPFPHRALPQSVKSRFMSSRADDAGIEQRGGDRGLSGEPAKRGRKVGGLAWSAILAVSR